MIRGAIENLLQINCQSEWGEGGVGIRIERIRGMLSRHNQTLTAPPSPTQAIITTVPLFMMIRQTTKLSLQKGTAVN